MEDVISVINKIRDHMEYTAFLVSKGNSEREAHGKIVESLVVLSQLENMIKNYSFNCLPVNNEANISKSLKNKPGHTFSTTKADVNQEIQKVLRRLPKWFKNPSQNNSQILINYIKLHKNNKNIDTQTLKQHCSSVKDFYGNYNQMKNFGEKNHGKVFEENDGIINLWEPVKDRILVQYNNFSQ